MNAAMRAATAIAFSLAVACGGLTVVPAADAGDAASDVATDAGHDAGLDAGLDAVADGTATCIAYPTFDEPCTGTFTLCRTEDPCAAQSWVCLNDKWATVANMPCADGGPDGADALVP